MDTPAEKDALGLLRLQLVDDLAALSSENGSTAKKLPISLCAKWIPFEKKPLDATLRTNGNSGGAHFETGFAEMSFLSTP
ncbi:hypothetical protein Gpo141_00006448 [Globisporangium polare]